jgi:hypothetical protein
MATQTDYSKVLLLTHPGAEWSLQDVLDINSLTWDATNSIPKPSLPEILTQLELVKPAEALRLLREKRNAILADSDMHALPDYPHPDEATKQAWLSYRQALRDMTQHSTPTLTVTLELDDAFVTWPSRPSA